MIVEDAVSSGAVLGVQPMRAGIVDNQAEHDWTRDGAQRPSKKPLQSQGKRAIVNWNYPGEQNRKGLSPESSNFQNSKSEPTCKDEEHF